MKFSIIGMLAMLIECINYLEAQKYWSCDPNCPLRCNKRDQSMEDIVCCYIPDVTILPITFTTVCHFDCANKCYSGGLRIHNKGPCEGRPSSSESDSISLEEVTTPGSNDAQDDAFGMGSRTEKDVFNETNLRQSSLDALEANARINDKEKVSGRLLGLKRKHHHSNKKRITTENTNYEIFENIGTIKDIDTNDIDVDAAIADLMNEDNEEKTKLDVSDGTRMGKKISRIEVPTNEENETVNDAEETLTSPTPDSEEAPTLPTNDLKETPTLLTNDLTTLMPTTSRIDVSTKKHHKKKKGSKSKNSTLPMNITGKNTMVTTTAVSSIVDMINLFPTTVSSIETSPLPTNTPSKRKHKKKKHSKNDATTASPD